MKKGILKTLLFITLMLLAVVLGKAAGTGFAGIRFLSWLGTSARFGISTVSVDLSVVQFTIGMMIQINVAQALLILASIFIYSRMK